MIMTKKKYQKSKQVTKISELENVKFIYIRDKIWHPAWWKSLQYSYLERQIDQGNVWLADNIGRNKK